VLGEKTIQKEVKMAGKRKSYVLIDTLMERLKHHRAVRAHVPDSEVILSAVVSATYVQNHLESAVYILRETSSLSG
jgi:3-mercaptopyruvate sulfurtransferase SseA